MDDLVLYFYSNGDLVMMLSKIIAYMLMLIAIAVILGCLRGLRL